MTGVTEAGAPDSSGTRIPVIRSWCSQVERFAWSNSPHPGRPAAVFFAAEVAALGLRRAPTIAMLPANPLRVPFPPRADRRLDRGLYVADARGTPILTSRVRVVLGSTHLHLGGDGLGPTTSIPLGWIRRVAPVGHGLRVEWRNAITGSDELLSLGVRGVLFYKPKLRDEIVALLGSAAKAAADGAPRGGGAGPAAPVARCEVCDKSSEVTLYPFQRFTGVVVTWSAAPDPRTLCRAHAAPFVRRTILRNAAIGTLGLMGIQALVHAGEILALAARTRAIDASERARLRFASFAVPLGLVALVALLAFASG